MKNIEKLRSKYRIGGLGLTGIYWSLLELIDMILIDLGLVGKDDSSGVAWYKVRHWIKDCAGFITMVSGKPTRRPPSAR